MAFPLDSRPVILTIAGFDPSSGAGITADLKTIAAHDCFGAACITALTVQNTAGVSRVEPVEADLIRETLDKIASDMPIVAVRIGMLGSAGAANTVADFLNALPRIPVVLDPVLRSSSGASLLDQKGIEVLKRRLLSLALVITPNLAEAAELTGTKVTSLTEMKAAAAQLQGMGARNVVITGGHLTSNTDLMRLESGHESEHEGRRIHSNSTHGTGCAFATALACNLAKGLDVVTAATAAKEYVRQAIEAAYPIGKGTGPINHLFRLK